MKFYLSGGISIGIYLLNNSKFYITLNKFQNMLVRKEGEIRYVMTVYLREKHKRMLDELATELKMSKNEIIRQLIKSAYTQYKKTQASQTTTEQ